MRKYLVELREKNGYTQQDVASKIGITRQYYQQIEAGQRQKRPDVTLLTIIASIYGLSIAEVIALENEVEEEP